MRTISFFCVSVVFDVCVCYIHVSVQYVHPFTTWGAQRKMSGAFPYYSASFSWGRASHSTLGHSQRTEVSLHFSLETDFWFFDLQDCKLTNMCCSRISCFAVRYSNSSCKSEVRNATWLLFCVSLSWGVIGSFGRFHSRKNYDQICIL